MDADKAAKELTVIRQLMERPVRYSTQSGLAGIIAGAAALGGLAADWHVSAHYGADPTYAAKINMIVWAGVFVVAFAGVAGLTHLRERRRCMPFWSSIKKRILLTIGLPFVAGAGLTLVVVARWYFEIAPNMWGLIPAIWMLFYGLACWQVGEFSVPEIRVMGAAFVVAGLAAGAMPHDMPYLTIGVTFGGFHIVYGAVVWIRHGG